MYFSNPRSSGILYFYTIMNSIIYNGSKINTNEPIITAGNRGLRYGDGLFETMKCVHGKIFQFAAHMHRLRKGAQALQFEIPQHHTDPFFEAQIISLLKKNQHEKSGRIRLSFFRANGGLYDAEHHRPNWLIETFPLSDVYHEWNINGWHLCLYDACRKSADGFSQFKHNNFLPYILAALEAQKQKCKDAVILNANGNICDTTVANIFIIKKETIYTPPISDGCVAGIQRAQLLEHLPLLGYQVEESSLTVADLLEADEIFVSNSLFVIRWVGQFENNNYGNNLTLKIYQDLKQTCSFLFC